MENKEAREPSVFEYAVIIFLVAVTVIIQLARKGLGK